MIVVKYVDAKFEPLANEIKTELLELHQGDISVRPAEPGDRKTDGGTLGIEDLILEVLLSKVVEFGLEKLFKYIKSLIAKKDKGVTLMIKVKSNGETVAAEKFKLGEPGQSLDNLEYQVNEATQ